MGFDKMPMLCACAYIAVIELSCGGVEESPPRDLDVKLGNSL